tara:strand:- start:211 stop:519 length:309 start_codon:yes stop_codon:yes gene_type:complete
MADMPSDVLASDVFAHCIDQLIAETETLRLERAYLQTRAMGDRPTWTALQAAVAALQALHAAVHPETEITGRYRELNPQQRRYIDRVINSVASGYWGQDATK